jgi:hypothetical protein
MKASLIIKPLSAKIFHDTSAIFKMDPFVRVIVGDQLINSPVCPMGGKTPAWNNVEMHMKTVNAGEIRFELWDKNKLTEDDLIGYGELALSAIVNNKYIDWLPIRRDHFLAGELLVEVYMKPDLEQEPIQENATEITQVKSLPTPMFVNPDQLNEMPQEPDYVEMAKDSMGTTMGEVMGTIVEEGEGEK